MTISTTTLLLTRPYIIEDYLPTQMELNNLPNKQKILPVPSTAPINLDVQTNFTPESLYYQTLNPEMSKLFKYVSEVKRDNKQLKTMNTQMEDCLKTHSEAIFISIAEKLYRIIKSSPKLSARLQELRLKEDDIEIKSLIEKLDVKIDQQKASDENSLEEWVAIQDSQSLEKEPVLVLIDTEAIVLEELHKQITTLQNAVKGNSSSQEFMLQVSELRKQTAIQKNPKTWDNLYKAGMDAISAMRGLYYVANIVISITPTILRIAPYIFPLSWLNLLQFFVSIIQG